MAERITEDDRRPSHFDERQNERVEPRAPDDFTTDVEHAWKPTDVGFPPERVEAVPVFLTEAPPQYRPLVETYFSRYNVDDGTPVRIAARDPRRKLCVVTQTNNLANGPVYIGHESTMEVWGGFQIRSDPAAWLTVEGNGDVYARCAEGETCEISVMTEYWVDDDRPIRR